MGVRKRAALYLLRKKGRSAILLLLLSFMVIFLLAGVSVRMGAERAAEDVRKSMKSGLVLERIFGVSGSELYTSTWDENGLEVVDAKANLFTETHMEEILKMEGVSGYYIQYNGFDVYSGLKLRPGYASSGINGEHWMEEYGMPETKEEEEHLQEDIKFSKLYSKVMAFHPVIEGKWEPSFLNGSLAIVEGRNIERTDERKTVISEELAEKNNLKVGDFITVSNYAPIESELYGSELKLEIVGIFRINFKQPYSEVTFEDQMIENMAFTDRVLKQWSTEEYQMHYNGGITGYRVGKAAEEIDNVRIFVDDPDLLSSIREQILSMKDVDWQYYEIEIDDTDYRAAAKPLLLIKKLFAVLLIALFAGTLMILMLSLSLWIRSRNHEIGILLSIGVKKKGILFQFLLECCIIAAAAFLLAGAAYRPVTRAVADVTAKVFAPPKDQEDYKMTYDLPTATFEIHREISEPVDFEYGISPKTAALIFLLVLLTVMAAALWASMQMIRQKPGALLRS